MNVASNNLVTPRTQWSRLTEALGWKEEEGRKEEGRGEGGRRGDEEGRRMQQNRKGGKVRERKTHGVKRVSEGRNYEGK